MTHIEYMLGIPPVDQKEVERAQELLRRDARAVLDNKYLKALLSILRNRARGQLQVVLAADDNETVRTARAKLAGYQQLFSEISQLEAAVKEKEKGSDNG